MKGSNLQPKVFISYSWSSPQHEQWVLELAERLSGDGVHVILDKWDLKEGQDMHKFMEQMVQDKKIEKVLVICDRSYQTRANDRKGGVGTETQLISKEVYENTEQEKFIPIVREYVDGSPCIPHYMSSRIYINLSTDATYEENYQRLVRNLYKKPLIQRPPLGTPPAYILADEPSLLATSHKVTEIKNALISDKRSSPGLIADYLDTFIRALSDFRISGGTAPDFDEQVLESIQKMTPLRDDFIEYTSNVFKFQETIDVEKFHDFFERILPFFREPEDATQHTRIDSDNYKFFVYELFLYFFSVLLQLKRYRDIAYFMDSQYFFRPPHRELAHVGIESFNNYVESLDSIRNKRLVLNRISVTADLIKERATRTDITFEDLKQTDLIICYLMELRGSWRDWFPRTSVYNRRGGKAVDLFERMISVQHFERIKVLFDVTSTEELQRKISAYLKSIEDGKRQSISNSWDYEIPAIQTVLDMSKIGTVK